MQKVFNIKYKLVVDEWVRTLDLRVRIIESTANCATTATDCTTSFFLPSKCDQMSRLFFQYFAI